MAFKERYNSISNSNPIEQALKNDDIKVPLSRLDYSRAHYGNQNIGTIEILDCFETMPNGKYTLSIDYLLKSRAPLTRRVFNGLRCYIKSFYMSWDDLWEGAQNHVDHGRSGLLDISKPYFDGYLYDSNNQITFDTVTPNSLLNQLGAPVRSYESDNVNKTSKLHSYVPALYSSATRVDVQSYVCKFNALELAMYQRIWISHFANKNLLQACQNFLPDNISKQRIAYSTTNINSLSSAGGRVAVYASTASVITNPNSVNYTATGDNSVVCNLFAKRYAQKKGTYFDTASPFADLIRGSIPSINLTNVTGNTDWTDAIHSVLNSESPFWDPDMQVRLNSDYFNDYTQGILVHTNGDLPEGKTYKQAIIESLNKVKITGQVQAALTARTLTTLLVANFIKERAARTNGDYREYVKAMYGKYPKVNSYEPTYIGGCYQDIVFSDVTSTTPTDSAPLGKQAGQAMSANHGEIGTFTAPDFGYIMTLCYLVPDDVENQGVPRHLCELSADDVYLPPNNNLPPQAIKNIEIFAGTSESTNNDVFGYTERYEHLRARDNYASGFVGLTSSISAEDKAMLMHVRHASLPQFNTHFTLLSPDNVDMSVFTVSTEPPFFFEALNNVSKLEPIPYDSTPADFGFKYV